MRERYLVIVACVILFLGGVATGMILGGFLKAPESRSEIQEDREVLYQVSTIDSLLQGAYEGTISIGELRHYGDFGIATLDDLDGEMVALDGNYYQVRADGRIILADNKMTVPFGSVTHFTTDRKIFLARADNFSDFASLAESGLPSRNLFYAVKIHGFFPYVKTRSIPAQGKPYPRLVDATANQSVFDLRNTTGTLAGFWTPDLARGLNIPGFHLHYLTDDRTGGGHVLDVSLENVSMELDETSGFAMGLPTSGSFTGVNLSGDLGSELAIVEQGQ
ncbi:MAG: acetolactate decarboxylase [Methanolinea sp.]|nr:acetolactate decarboxylase [Methanolinea sp.]